MSILQKNIQTTNKYSYETYYYALMVNKWPEIVSDMSLFYRTNKFHSILLCNDLYISVVNNWSIQHLPKLMTNIIWQLIKILLAYTLFIIMILYMVYIFANILMFALVLVMFYIIIGMVGLTIPFILSCIYFTKLKSNWYIVLELLSFTDSYNIISYSDLPRVLCIGTFVSLFNVLLAFMICMVYMLVDTIMYNKN